MGFLKGFLRTALTLSCLILFLTACAWNKPLIKERIIYVNPPSNLLIPTDIPRFSGSTCSDIIIDYIPELKAAIQSCNIDKESIRKLNNEVIKD